MIPRAILVGASLIFASASSAAASGFYVSASSSDSADGSSAHPFATLRRVVSAMAQSSTHTTYLGGGKYYMSSTVNLGSADSGMTIQSTPGSGHRPIDQTVMRPHPVTPLALARDRHKGIRSAPFIEWSNSFK